MSEIKKWILEIDLINGNSIIKKLQSINAIDTNFKIHSQNNSIFIPLKHEIDNLSVLLNGYEFKIFPAQKNSKNLIDRKKTHSKSLKETLKEIIPSEFHNLLPRAFDIIGDIAIIELNRDEQKPLRPFINSIGQILLENHSNIKSVYEKASDIEGLYRTRKFDLIAGLNKTETIHRENLGKFHVDIEQTFFSPRLAYERQRIAKLKTEFNLNGKIWDVFCGVGPFIIQISKKNPKAHSIGTDINCRAIELAKKNIELNKIVGNIEFYCQDVKEISISQVFSKFQNSISRFIMNLPEKSIQFLKNLPQFIQKNGALLHLYQFNKKINPIQEAKDIFEKELKNTRIKLKEYKFSKVVKPFSPNIVMTVLDAIISL
ncbi:class I SAM-dependent methyltransferase family protein [Promethearchaeum syntrophicum]|uniref:tRNA (guanine(37)-N(1))-methyltransferase n=1 Tax=Promethearchaeum syntrophicum TaxID=2594042 RepID=A0A5B9D868_9ARCH|nr:methyltransferase domain-containing protein [Candidatus Prometheoarchaeum syntrophicum]